MGFDKRDEVPQFDAVISIVRRGFKAQDQLEVHMANA
jgi:hypothetical protein